MKHYNPKGDDMSDTTVPDKLTATFPVDLIPLPYGNVAAFTPHFWGVKHMMGFIGGYNPPPDEPEPPQGGTPITSNIIPFRRKTNGQSRPVYQSVSAPMRKAA